MMKINRIMIIALIVLFVISAIFVRLNIKNTSEQDMIRRKMINHAYSEMMNISQNLDGLIQNIESETTSYETNQQSLTLLSQSFVRLDTILKQYGNWFPANGFGVNVYSGNIFDFGFISYTLTAGTGTANGMPYSGITADGVISGNEIRYLVNLKNDIDEILAAMVSDENPPNERQDITIPQFDGILNNFFSKWSFQDENSPYYLLRSELRSMTLNDVRTIAENIGPDLTMGDFAAYSVDDLGEGLYGYRVVGGPAPYNLIVASDDMYTVKYTKFYNALYGGLLGDTTETIDIRYYDVDKFIADGTQELVRPLP